MKKSLSFILVVFGVFLVSTLALAETGAGEGGWQVVGSNYGWTAIAAALAIGLAAMGGALGQGRAAAAALDGIARNPGASGKIFVPMILGMALIESLVLFGLLIAFNLSGKL